MRYIDFDGVILDTEDILFEEWRNSPERFELPQKEKIKYIQKKNWGKILNESPIINDSIYILNQMNIYTTAILTKIHSLENEGYEKIKFLRKCGVKQNIILVPYELKKTDVVSPFGNILIDDSLKNLKEWEQFGGYPMFFDKKENNIDSFGIYNEQGYQRVLRIDDKLTH